MLVIRPRAGLDMLWAMEQALRSGACGAVLGWTGAADDQALRRLKLAAEEGRSHRLPVPAFHPSRRLLAGGTPARARRARLRHRRRDPEVPGRRARAHRSPVDPLGQDFPMLEGRPAGHAGTGEPSTDTGAGARAGVRPAAGSGRASSGSPRISPACRSMHVLPGTGGARGRRHRPRRSAAQPSSPATSVRRARASRPA